MPEEFADTADQIPTNKSDEKNEDGGVAVAIGEIRSGRRRSKNVASLVVHKRLNDSCNLEQTNTAGYKF